MTEEVGTDLNEVIATAVQAKISASVLEALSGDEVYGRLVSAALNERIEVKKDYNTIKIPYISHVIRQAIQAAVKVAVAEFIQADQEKLKAAVVKALREKRDEFAGALVDNLVSGADKVYGIKVELRLPSN